MSKEVHDVIVNFISNDYEVKHVIIELFGVTYTSCLFHRWKVQLTILCKCFKLYFVMSKFGLVETIWWLVFGACTFERWTHYYGWKNICWSTLCIYGWKHEIRSHKVCGWFLKFVFQNFEKSPWEHYISKNSFNSWNNFLYFQSYSYKIFMKIHHVWRVFLYIESTQEKHVDNGFFVTNVIFPYQMFTKSFQFFCEL